MTDECGSGTGTVAIQVPLSITTSGLQASMVTQTRIDVIWPVVSGATSYTVERRSGATWDVLGTATSSNWTDGTVSANRTYAYRVYASGNGSESNYSNDDVATTMSFTAVNAGDTVTAASFNEMLMAVNKVREAVGWPAVTWANILAPNDPVPTPGVVITGRQVTSCRARMNEALQALGVPVVAYTDPDLVLRWIEAEHVSEVKERAK